MNFLHGVQIRFRLARLIEQGQKRDRTPAFVNQEFEQIVFVVRDLSDIGPGQGNLDCAAPLFFHDLAQRAPLGPAGIATGERAALKADMVVENGAGQAERAGAHGGAKQPLHLADFVRGSFPLKRLFAHHIVPQGRESGQRSHVDAHAALLQDIEILGVGFPLPVNTALHDLERNRFDIHQIPHDNIAGFGSNRRNTHPAVAHHHRGNAVPGGAGHQRVPGDLGIVVGMRINKPRSQHQAVGIDFLLGRLAIALPHRGNQAVFDRHITVEAGRARAVADTGVFNNQVVHECSLLFANRSQSTQVNPDAGIQAHRHPIPALLSGLEFLTPRRDAGSNFLLPFGGGGIFTHHVKNGLAMRFGLTGMGIEKFKVVSAQAVFFFERAHQALHGVIAARLAANRHGRQSDQAVLLAAQRNHPVHIGDRLLGHDRLPHLLFGSAERLG